METKAEPRETAETFRVEVELSAQELRQLDERARQAGTGRAEYISHLIRQSLDLAPGDETLHPDMTFAEILAPVHDYSRKMGYTEEELDAVFEQAREEAYQERRAAERRAESSSE
jgi:hypothetical protein